MTKINFEKYDGFIFDLDGTLADTMPLHYLAWTAAIEAVNEGKSPFTEELFYENAGVASTVITHWLNKHFHLNLPVEQLVEDKENRFLDLLAHVKPIMPVFELVKKLGPTAKMAIASGGVRKNVQMTVDALKLRPYFKVIVCFDDVEHGKPAPDMFLLAAKLLDVEPKRCVVFEDGEPGFIAAKAAGMDVIDVKPYYTPSLDAV